MFTFYVLAVLVSSAAGVTIGFGENDYSEREGSSPMIVSVTKEGTITGNITIRVTPMTLNQYQNMFGDPPEDADGDPAEVEDFNNAPEEYVFTPATSSADVDVAIEITDDSIQEVNEIFLVVLEVVIINDQDKAGLILSRNVSIGRIRLDPSDVASVGFNDKEFSVSEAEGDISDTLYIVRVGDAEQIQRVEVQVVQLFDEATLESDFKILQTVFDMQPTVDRLAVPITIVDDAISEENERFRVNIQSNAASVDFARSSATLRIIDNDVVTVGFNQVQYEVEEGKTIEVCIVIFEPQEVDVDVDLDISTVPSNVSERIQPLDKVAYLNGVDVKEDCITVETKENDRAEYSYVFTLKAEVNLLDPNNTLQIVAPSIATVTVIDNDGTPNAPEILAVYLVNDRKDMFIEWEAEKSELRPIDSYFSTVHVDSVEKTDVRRQAITENDAIQFTTEETFHTLENVDLDKSYEITICANNSFGFNCSGPVSYPPGLGGTNTTNTTNTTKPPSEVGNTTEKPTDDDLEPGVIAILIILPLLFLLVCCLLLLLLLCCLCCQRDESKTYYPEKREKKNTEEFERYRKNQSPSADSEFDSDFEDLV